MYRYNQQTGYTETTEKLPVCLYHTLVLNAIIQYTANWQPFVVLYGTRHFVYMDGMYRTYDYNA